MRQRFSEPQGEAAVVIAMVPCAVLSVGLQRFSISGLMSGAVKGERVRPATAVTYAAHEKEKR
jgi:hypothetical protein